MRFTPRLVLLLSLLCFDTPAWAQLQQSEGQLLTVSREDDDLIKSWNRQMVSRLRRLRQLSAELREGDSKQSKGQEGYQFSREFEAQLFRRLEEIRLLEELKVQLSAMQRGLTEAKVQGGNLLFLESLGEVRRLGETLPAALQSDLNEALDYLRQLDGLQRRGELDLASASGPSMAQAGPFIKAMKKRLSNEIDRLAAGLRLDLEEELVRARDSGDIGEMGELVEAMIAEITVMEQALALQPQQREVVREQLKVLEQESPRSTSKTAPVTGYLPEYVYFILIGLAALLILYFWRNYALALNRLRQRENDAERWREVLAMSVERLNGLQRELDAAHHIVSEWRTFLRRLAIQAEHTLEALLQIHDHWESLPEGALDTWLKRALQQSDRLGQHAGEIGAGLDKLQASVLTDASGLDAFRALLDKQEKARMELTTSLEKIEPLAGGDRLSRRMPDSVRDQLGKQIEQLTEIARLLREASDR